VHIQAKALYSIIVERMQKFYEKMS
jgi:hypothetical protein